MGGGVLALTAAPAQGLPTIRAYGAQSRFRDDFLAQMDLNGSWWFAFIATARWVGFRLDNIAAAVLMLASIFVMALHSKVCTAAISSAGQSRQMTRHL